MREDWFHSRKPILNVKKILQKQGQTVHRSIVIIVGGSQAGKQTNTESTREREREREGGDKIDYGSLIAQLLEKCT